MPVCPYGSGGQPAKGMEPTMSSAVRQSRCGSRSESEAGESTPSNSDEDGSDEEMLLSELLGSTPDRPVSVDVDDD